LIVHTDDIDVDELQAGEDLGSIGLLFFDQSRGHRDQAPRKIHFHVFSPAFRWGELSKIDLAR
jgi:hypothetical protein